jgi:hypothetical protein
MFKKGAREEKVLGESEKALALSLSPGKATG